jgi:hypothetical protein
MFAEDDPELDAGPAIAGLAGVVQRAEAMIEVFRMSNAA